MRLGGALATLSGMAGRASNQLATVVVTLVATRFLGPTDFGVFALAALAVTLIRTLLHTGAFEFLLKAPAASECSSECLTANVGLSICLSLLIGSGVAVAVAAFGLSRVTLIMLLLLPSNLIAAVGAWREALLLRTRRLTLYYGLTTGAEIMAATVAVILLFKGYGIYALVGQVYLRNLVLLVLYLSTGRLELSHRYQRTKLREINRWSRTRYASVFLDVGGSYGMDVFLGIFLSPAATGLYRASSRLITAASDVFTQPIRLIAMTTFSTRAAGGRGSNQIWPAMLALIVAVAGSVLAGVAVVAPLLVPLVLGPRWEKAAQLLPILAFIRATSLFDAVTGPLLVAYNHQRTLLRLQVVISLVGLVLLLIAIRHGLLAASIAVLIASLTGRAVFATVTLRLIPPAGVGGKSLALVMLAPVAATIAGSLLAREAAAVARVGAVASALSVIVGGAAAWGVTMLLLRRHLRGLASILQAGDAGPRSRSAGLFARPDPAVETEGF